MQVEHDIRIIAIDQDFDEELKKMQEAGWRPAPGFPPFAVYPVVRDESTMPKPDQTAGFGGKLGGHIDDSKVHILRSDGTREPV